MPKENFFKKVIFKHFKWDLGCLVNALNQLSIYKQSLKLKYTFKVCNIYNNGT